MAEDKAKELSRRDFLKVSRNAAIGASIIGILPNWIWVRDGLAAVPVSGGYLLVDTKKCQGCITCMLSCSLVHEGVANPSLARIQIMQNSFESFPNDVAIAQCRQCEDPVCVTACPVNPKALDVNPEYGNVRMVDQDRCIGCGSCVNACAQRDVDSPSRPIVADEDGDGNRKSRKCDLCADTPYHWDKSTGGGPNGKQACVEVCPMSAIKFTTQMPNQTKTDKLTDYDEGGYNVNLRRSDAWGDLGYPTD